MVKMLWLLYPLYGCLSCSITSGILRIVGGQESAHTILEARITLDVLLLHFKLTIGHFTKYYMYV